MLVLAEPKYLEGGRYTCKQGKDSDCEQPDDDLQSNPCPVVFKLTRSLLDSILAPTKVLRNACYGILSHVKQNFSGKKQSRFISVMLRILVANFTC